MTAIGNSNVAFSVTESFTAQDNQHSVKDEAKLSEAELSEKSTVLNNVTAKCTDSFPCHICGKYFFHASSLCRHKKTAHPHLQSGTISCKEKSCSFSCRSLHELRSHLKDIHNFYMEEECKDFETTEGTYSSYIIY